MGANPTAETLDAYDVAMEAFARTEHGKVVRLCRWFETMKVKGLNCTP